jgi:hypothetical protein
VPTFLTTMDAVECDLSATVPKLIISRSGRTVAGLAFAVAADLGGNLMTGFDRLDTARTGNGPPFSRRKQRGGSGRGASVRLWFRRVGLRNHPPLRPSSSCPCRWSSPVSFCRPS